ncbi:MAG: DUF2600 family protein [Bacillota bacterium]|nr:DUF2600 family protein [Bacillota bacterium]
MDLPSTFAEILTIVRLVRSWPRIEELLSRWEVQARSISDPELQTQALASLSKKRFHCLGGSLYALEAPLKRRDAVQRAIVALQTISDYLDNLVDRSPHGGEEDFRRLHRAFLLALQPGEPQEDYYALHPLAEDAYLPSLVAACQGALEELPHWPFVRNEALSFARRYVELQVRKHVPGRQKREELLLAFYREEAARNATLGDITWPEQAAATGSTLGIFALFAVAAQDSPPDEARCRALERTYYPWLGGLHILLDYYIDLDEDRDGGDLNFVAYLPPGDEGLQRLLLFYRRSLEEAKGLPGPLHCAAAHGLPGFYLSDPKAWTPSREGQTRRLLKKLGPKPRLLFRLSRWLRHMNVLR